MIVQAMKAIGSFICGTLLNLESRYTLVRIESDPADTFRLS